MTDKMREEFEAWFVDNHGGLPGIPNYASPFTTAAWKAWRASRESMKAINLPVGFSAINDDYDRGYMDALCECESSVMLAGYKVE